MKYLLVAIVAISLCSCFEISVQETTDNLNKEVSVIPWPFTLCGDGDWTIEAVTIDQTPKRNINDQIIVTGTAKDSVTFKRVDIIVKLNGAFLDKQSTDYTNSYDQGDSVKYSFKTFIPGFAPSGSYSMTLQFIDSSDKNNGCLIWQWKL